jgi:hypothetical protein
MGKLVIERRSEFLNRGRSIGLYLNEEKIGTIENGEIKEFKLEPGNYNLRAEIDWCGSPNRVISINQKQLKKFELTGFSKNKWVLPILITLQIILIGLDYLININIYLKTTYMIGAILFITYPVSFGRNNYLKLIEK